MNEIKKQEVPEAGKNSDTGFKSIKAENGMTKDKADSFVKGIFENNESGIEKIKCINEDLAGKKHSETGVPFERKIVNVFGSLKEVVVPVFDSKFDAQLPNDKLTETDAKQFAECNNQLKEAIEKNPKLAKQFDKEQLEQIMDGETPDGYTWHHDAEVGKMQLVDTDKHQKTGHTGGRFIWGGGSDFR